MQVIPHITDEIKQRILIVAESQAVDFVITEIGGTVGDIESLPFLEAIRQLYSELGPKRCMFLHLTLVPYIGHAGEMKTKPTQHSVNELRRIGIQPHALICRSERGLDRDIRKKIALFACVPEEAVLSARDVDNIYKVPLVMRAEGADDLVLDHFGVDAPRARARRVGGADPPRRRLRGDDADRPGRQVRAARRRLQVGDRGAHPRRLPPRRPTSRSKLVDSEDFDAERDRRVGRRDPDPRRLRRARDRGQDRGGAGRPRARHPVPGHLPRDADRGRRVRPPRRRHGRRQLDRVRPRDARIPVVDLLPEQKEVSDMGGTMRLGADPVKLHDGTRAREIFGEAVIYKRHRHRYEVNNQLRRRLEDEGLVCGGTSPDERLVEIVELPEHPFYVASQFHPEFNSRPNRPEPLFRDFVGAAAQLAADPRRRARRPRRPRPSPPRPPRARTARSAGCHPRGGFRELATLTARSRIPSRDRVHRR